MGSETNDEFGVSIPPPPRLPSSVPQGAPEPPSAAPRRANKKRLALFALSSVALVAGGAFLAVHHCAGEALVEFGGATPALVLVLPCESEGERVSVLGQIARVEGGRARVDLVDDALTPGTTTVVATIDGDTREFEFEVPFVALVDHEARSANPPRLGIRVAAMVGDIVLVDGAPITLDAQGRGEASIDAPSDGSTLEHEFVIEVSRGATIWTRNVRVQSIGSSLEITQPPANFVSDRASLVLDARVSDGARAFLDGRELHVESGRVLADLPLAQPGTYRYRIEVLEPGKRRRIETRVVRRVLELGTLLDAFEVDAELPYEALVAAENRGKRVAFEGRVVQVRVDSGRTFASVAITRCAAISCPIRVEYPVATFFHASDLVRIAGFVREPISSAAGPIPRVEASFLVEEAR